MTYLEELDDALRDCGLNGHRRQRIVAEFADHLHENPSANIGEPWQIARRFADELGTHHARSAALTAFGALAITGLVVGVRGVAMLPWNTDGSGSDTASLLAAFLAGQVALAAGGLAVLRALRLRRESTISRREATVLARRGGGGVAAGAVTVIAFPFRQSYAAHPGAVQIGHGSTSWVWPAISAAALLALAAATPAVIRAVRIRPQAVGPAGDLLADLGQIAHPTRTPTRFALLFAGMLTLLATVAGVVANDPYDGAIRGVVEGAACLVGYGLLGGYLGLRRTTDLATPPTRPKGTAIDP
jgi:hypothetical protein